MGNTTKGEYKPGLLVVLATSKGFGKPWSILIDSGASSNYVRRLSLEGNQQYAEAPKAQDGDSITVRLATGARVTVPKVPLNLGLKFLDFNSVERCLVLDLDSRYDLILGMAWLERHEPWIDWRSKTLGATRIVSDEALESHEPTFARKQKCYWREPLTDSVNVLDIGVSELINSDVNNNSVEQSSMTLSGTARIPLRDTQSNIETLDVGNDIGSRIEQVKVDDLVSDIGCKCDSLDVDNDIGSRIEKVEIDDLVSEVTGTSDPLGVGNDIGPRIG